MTPFGIDDDWLAGPDSLKSPFETGGLVLWSEVGLTRSTTTPYRGLFVFRRLADDTFWAGVGEGATWEEAGSNLLVRDLRWLNMLTLEAVVAAARPDLDVRDGAMRAARASLNVWLHRPGRNKEDK